MIYFKDMTRCKGRIADGINSLVGRRSRCVLCVTHPCLDTVVCVLAYDHVVMLR